MKIKDNSGIKFVELYVGMGKMVAWWHQYALGFELKGKRTYQGQYGEEITYWLQQGSANLLITSAMDPSAHDVVSFVDRHGNSIKRFALEVEDIESTMRHLQSQKAIFLSGMEEITYGTELVRFIRIKLFDDNEIMLIETGSSFGPLPGFIPVREEMQENSGIQSIDHLASVVRVNESSFWNDYLVRILELAHIQSIGEEFFANLLTGMKMNVLHHKSANINKVIVEPLPEKSRKSQVDTFLQHNFGTGIQHLAFEVSDLLETVRCLRSKGVVFTPVPESYYRALQEEHPELPIAQLKEANILSEQEDDKILLQVFTEPIGDRPTLFYEFIQRVNNYDGFGAKNVHHLFKSLEIQLNGEP